MRLGRSFVMAVATTVMITHLILSDSVKHEKEHSFRKRVSGKRRTSKNKSSRQYPVKVNFRHARIVNGESASVGELPFMLSVRRNGRQGCGAVLTALPWVGSQIILTAAHCLIDGSSGKPIPAQELTVAGGSLLYEDNRFPAQILTIKGYRIHPSFSVGSRQHDLALLFPHQWFHVNLVLAPISLPPPLSYGAYPGKRLLISGWGIQDPDSNMENAQELQKTEVPVVDQRLCVVSWKDNGVSISPSQICTGVSGETGGTSCGGDSGGPILGDRCGYDHLDNKHHHVLVGLVSFGPENCTDSELPSVGTRLSYFVDWIVYHAGVHWLCEFIPFFRN